MKMPNFASLDHSGGSYFCRDSQSGRYGPWRAAASTSLRIAARGASYFSLAFCQSWSIRAGSCEAVGNVCALAVPALAISNAKTTTVLLINRNDAIDFSDVMQGNPFQGRNDKIEKRVAPEIVVSADFGCKAHPGSDKSVYRDKNVGSERNEISEGD